MNLDKKGIKITDELMLLVGAAAAGMQVEPPQTDIGQLLALSVRQTVQPLLICALESFPEAVRDCGVYARQREELRSRLIQEHFRLYQMARIFAQFDAEGIPIIVLKGYGVAACYAQPDFRVSDDVDLYIEPENERIARMILERNGFTLRPVNGDDYHVECIHPQIGIVELHTSLFRKITAQSLLAGLPERLLIQEPYLRVSMGGECDFYTLGPTDHLIFLALHMIKHFTGGGLNLRMMTDIGCYYLRYRDRIDHRRFHEFMTRTRNIGLIDAVFQILEQKFGMDCGYAPVGSVPQETLELLIRDTFERTWTSASMEQWISSGIEAFRLRRLIIAKGFFRGGIYALVRKLANYREICFPPIKKMRIEYPVLIRYPFLAPIKWMQSFIKRAKNYAAKKRAPVSLGSGNRIELFRKLHMID